MLVEEQRIFSWEVETRVVQQDKSEGRRQGCEIYEARKEKGLGKRMD